MVVLMYILKEDVLLRFLVLLSLFTLVGCFNSSNYIVEKKYFQDSCGLHNKPYNLGIQRPFYRDYDFVNQENHKVFNDKGKEIAADQLGFAFNERYKEVEGRKIAIFIDGTGMSGGGKETTNIRKMYNSAVEQACSQAIIPYYHSGLGTSFGKVVRGSMMGEGINEHIKDAYHFLAQTYKEGDQVYLFGFSRGAYTVRALNGLLEFAGLVQFKSAVVKDMRDSEKQTLLDDAVDVIFNAYNTNNDGRQAFEHRLRQCIKKAHNNEEADKSCIAQNLNAEDFKTEIKNHNPNFTLKSVKVKGVGVFDTVPALGVGRDDFPDNYRVGLYAEKTFHAISLDEQRDDFRVLRFQHHVTSTNRLEQFNRAENRQFLKEVWFAGDHSDVGGGNRCPSGLEKISRDWMVENFKSDNLFIDNFKSKPCLSDSKMSHINDTSKSQLQYKHEKGILHDQFLAGGVLGWVYVRGGLHWRKPKINDTLHGSIMCRLAIKKLPVSHKEREHTGRYQPTNLYLKPSKNEEDAWFKDLGQHYNFVAHTCLNGDKIPASQLMYTKK